MEADVEVNTRGGAKTAASVPSQGVTGALQAHGIREKTAGERLCIVAAILCTCVLFDSDLRAGELDQFVRRKTQAFDYELKSKEPFGKLGKGYRFQLTSQNWKDRTWSHDLRLFIPDGAEGDIPVFMVVVGGEGAWKPIKMTAQFSEGTGYALALLGNVPNQPMFDGLHEDNLIAHTFVKYLESGDATWPLLFPMTRSVVRAMDALDGFAKDQLGNSFGEYVVGGSSKRGWTTWLTGAVDDRVSGMLPMVYDNLNVPKQMKNQIDVWGEYTDKIKPYTKRNFPERLQSEQGRKLVRLTDPYAYRDRYDVPTLMISGTNDPFWPLNSVNLFRDDMSHELYQLYLPNTGHGVGEEFFNVANTIKAFLMHVDGGLTFPTVQAEAERTGQVVQLNWSTTDGPDPEKVTVWVARQDSSDFRKAKWKSNELESGVEAHEISMKSASHLACFVRFACSENGQSFQLSSRVFLFDNAD